MEEVVRYTYRLRPGATAEAALLAEWGRCRWLWNEAVHQYKTGRKPTFGKLSKLLTEARARSSWLREGSQVAQQQTLRTYALALQHSFKVKGRGRPRPKRRKDTLPSLGYTVRGFSIRDQRLRLPGGVTIPVVWSRELPSAPTSVRIYQDTIGHWYASFVVRRDTTPAPDVEGAIGVDWGVTTTATTTDPAYDLPHLGHRKRCAAELAKLQRRMARRRRSKGVTPSNGYLRAKHQAAKLAKKAARQNTHDARVWAKKVVDNHATIAVEDFTPTFLAKSRMARKAADAAIGAAKRELINRGMRAGRRVVLVPPAYTTMTCSQCGTRAKHRLGLGVRVFRCDTCGHTACRDRNAARTILATAERGRAGADDVRHAITSSRDGRLVRSEPEIPRLPAMGKR
ncbi:RNA-guided endonuclease TnpB family protein [Plantactinospora sp. BC1]|uniref:RNA-guided endonuclease InsQ/TnpB family protein n=1 Tax=Plantactinospora sp. BC1 TaxID=2108470 RepID=UPI0018FE8245|nr:RNA-guided endonuclease TnpB family protein [Plantactinospora sp. BC1]